MLKSIYLAIFFAVPAGVCAHEHKWAWVVFIGFVLAGCLVDDLRETLIEISKPRPVFPRSGVAPMKYTLSVEVKLQEVPEEPEPITLPPGGDPMQVLATMANRVGVIARPQPFMFGNAGFDFRKSAQISVSDFAALADIVSRFDTLVHNIELGAIGAELQP